MIARDRVLRTLNHQPIDRAPRDLWVMPDVETDRPDDVAEINGRFPTDILHVAACGPAAKRGKGDGQPNGGQADVWGCAWHPDKQGSLAGLVHSPLAGSTALGKYEPPRELLDPARFAKVNPVCDASGQFALAKSEARPLDRLRELRGPESAVVELCDGNKDLVALLERLHDFFCKEIDLWAKTQVDGVVLGDDLSWVAAARGNLKIWRSLFKPLLQHYCSALHAHDKFVFFRSEGPTGEVLEDLVEAGVDAVHASWPAEEFESLARRYRGRVTFWGGVERKYIEPPCQCCHIREAVFRVRKSLDFGAGGVISLVSWGRQIPLQNIATFFEQWLIPLPVTV